MLIAFCIGAAFIAVVSAREHTACPASDCNLTPVYRPQFYTTLNNIWSKTEEVWEGTFSLVAWSVFVDRFR